jgi:hypothetical protein
MESNSPDETLACMDEELLQKDNGTCSSHGPVANSHSIAGKKRERKDRVIALRVLKGSPFSHSGLKVPLLVPVVVNLYKVLMLKCVKRKLVYDVDADVNTLSQYLMIWMMASMAMLLSLLMMWFSE